MDSDTNLSHQYRKFLLNRVTATGSVVSYIDHCSLNLNETQANFFHKVMVHNWSEAVNELFQALNHYFESKTIPVCVKQQGDIISFYTNNINFISKIVKNDFMFPHLRNMYNIDVLLNDRTSTQCFNEPITISTIISNILSKRFNEKCVLDLSDFCNDPEFKEKEITFLNFSSLLFNHIPIMNTLGKETKTLNLSNNNFSQVPVDVLNYFVKGELIAVNLSNNDISSLTHLTRISSKIEKLWLEGNPLCDNIDPTTYVKQITMRFPRLIELDGVRITNHGIAFPFFRNFLTSPDRKTKMLVDKFLSLYFTHYDSFPRKVDMFYNMKATLTVHTDFTDAEDKQMPEYALHSRNILHPVKRMYVMFKNKVFNGRQTISAVFQNLPETIHDPTTFTVDVISQDKKHMIIVVDGTFKELKPKNKNKTHFRFRRTFVFNVYTVSASSVYQIEQEMFNITIANKDLIDDSFKVPIRNLNSMNLIDPEEDDKDSFRRVFSHLTQLKKAQVEARLMMHNWDIKAALKNFQNELKLGTISQDSFTYGDEDDFSDRSSLLSDEID